MGIDKEAVLMMNRYTKAITESLHDYLNQAGNVNSKDFYHYINHYLTAINCYLASIGYLVKHINNPDDKQWLDSLIKHHMSECNAVVMYKGHPNRLMNPNDVKYLNQIIIDISKHSEMTYCDALHFIINTTDRHVLNF